MLAANFSIKNVNESSTFESDIYNWNSLALALNPKYTVFPPFTIRPNLFTQISKFLHCYLEDSYWKLLYSILATIFDILDTSAKISKQMTYN